jgi:hypothetical protein
MKLSLYSLLLTLSLTSAAAAQSSLVGTWQGRLEAEPGKALTIQFVFTASPAGGYSAVVTSPDDGAIKNAPVKSVNFVDGKLALDVPALSGAYTGTLRNGVLEGEWSQAGTKLPLSLRPYQPHALTKADVEVLRGEWFGTLAGPGGTVTIVLRFVPGADGALQGTLEVPEQGAKNIEAKEIALDNGYFSLAIPLAQTKISGALKGDQIEARWNQFGMSMPLTLKKGKYVALPNYLDLPVAARDLLKGSWTGTLNGLAVRVRFETDAQGRMLAFFDSLQQNMLNLPIKEASLSGTTLTLGLAAGPKYTGELSGGKLAGQWNQPGLPKPLPLELTRQK